MVSLFDQPPSYAQTCMTGQFKIRPSTAVDAPALSLLGQATFLEAFAGILDGPDIMAPLRTRSRSGPVCVLARDGDTGLMALPQRSRPGRLRVLHPPICRCRSAACPSAAGVLLREGAAAKSGFTVAFGSRGSASQLTVGTTVCDELVMSLSLSCSVRRQAVAGTTFAFSRNGCRVVFPLSCASARSSP